MYTTNQPYLDQDALEHTEGNVARTIEDKTARVPSDWFLWAGLGALGAAAIMGAGGKKDGGLFVGQLAAPLLIMGLYNKIVKVAGSDRVQAQTGL